MHLLEDLSIVQIAKWGIVEKACRILNLGARNGHIELIQLLLDYGAEINTQSNFDNKTPLHEASFWDHVEVAELLILNGANVNARSYSGHTPLSDAQANSRMIALLKSHGATDYGSVD